jgi:hypothetical protein
LRGFCRTILVSLLVASLADLPAAQAASRAVGFVLAAESSQIDGIGAASGTNLFPGDQLSTAENGGIRVQFGADQIYMLPSSAVTLANESSGLTAVLSAGALEFAAPNGAGIAVRAEDVLIHASAAQSTFAQITVLPNKQLEIASISGPLALELDGESYSLAPGRTYGVRVVDDEQDQQSAQNAQARPAKKRRRRLAIFLLLGSAAAAAVILAVVDHHHHHESDYTP